MVISKKTLIWMTKTYLTSILFAVYFFFDDSAPKLDRSKPIRKFEFECGKGVLNCVDGNDLYF